MKYNALRKLPTFNQDTTAEDYLVKWLSNGPFSKINHESVDCETKIAYLVAVQPYLDQVSSFRLQMDARASLRLYEEPFNTRKSEPELMETIEG